MIASRPIGLKEISWMFIIWLKKLSKLSLLQNFSVDNLDTKADIRAIMELIVHADGKKVGGLGILGDELNAF
jgi:hypothetical protein